MFTNPENILTEDRLERTLFGQSMVISGYLCCCLLGLAVLMSRQFEHWSVIPILGCGILIGTDAVDWARGRLSTFDPRGLIGFLGIHFFFVAPLLHILWDHWTLYQVTPPGDWRIWIGLMASLNFLGLSAYRLTSTLVWQRYERWTPKLWSMNRGVAFVLLTGGLITSAILQIWVYSQFGGLEGFIRVSQTELSGVQTAMRHMGFVFMISESFPILVFIAFAFLMKERQIRHWGVIITAFVIFFCAEIFFGGLRGSRSNTVFELFWAAGIVGLWLRPVSRKMITFGCIFLSLFMYFYGLFKFHGLEALNIMESSATWARLEEESGRDLPSLILGDFSRSDVHAYLLYRISSEDTDYELALGRTYFAALHQLVPRSLVDRPATKVLEGTEAIYGRGSFEPDVFLSWKVYGLAGEALLNFGPVSVPLIFAIFGGFVGLIARVLKNLDPGDLRRLIAPLFLLMCVVLLIGDLDNVVFVFFKLGTVPCLVVLLSVHRIRNEMTRIGIDQ